MWPKHRGYSLLIPLVTLLVFPLLLGHSLVEIYSYRILYEEGYCYLEFAMQPSKLNRGYLNVLVDQNFTAADEALGVSVVRGQDTVIERRTAEVWRVGPIDCGQALSEYIHYAIEVVRNSIMVGAFVLMAVFYLLLLILWKFMRASESNATQDTVYVLD